MTPQERDARDCNAIAHNAAELAPGWARVVPLAERTLVDHVNLVCSQSCSHVVTFKASDATLAVPV